MAEERTWRVGDLARTTGLTVRALHHYDQLGLLSPAWRTEGGHRTYTADDVRRLHRIVTLRSLGISLEEIGRLLDGVDDPGALLRRQLQVVDERIRHTMALRSRLLVTLESLEGDSEPTTEQLLTMIEETAMMNEPITPEQLAKMRTERLRRMGAMSDAEFAASKRALAEAWKALNRQEQARLVELRHRALAGATDDPGGLDR